MKKWLEPPHMTHIVGFCSMWTMPGSCQNLEKSIQVVARADLAPPPVCPLSPHQFVHFWLSIFQKFCCCISQYFISYLFSTVMDPDFSVLIVILCPKQFITSVIGSEMEIRKANTVVAVNHVYMNEPWGGRSWRGKKFFQAVF